MLIKGGKVFYKNKLRNVDVLIKNNKIVEIGEDINKDKNNKVDATEKLVIPGGVDIHVHFREPGYTYKEDWRSGSQSAISGGITTVVDQPNTSPPTIDGGSFDLKRKLAEEKAIVDFGINAGVTKEWDLRELKKRNITAYGEIFMADSTGKMGISTELFREALNKITRKPITIHAEDPKLINKEDRKPEAEIRAVEKSINIAEKTNSKLHFAHISLPRSIELIENTKHTCEVTPHHLFLSEEKVDNQFSRVNPPLRSEDTRKKLWRYYTKGKIDVVASDHAPHTVEEKKQGSAGFPGVETLMPLLLNEVYKENLKLTRVIKTTSINPAKIMDKNTKGEIKKGKDADIVIVDIEKRKKIKPKKLHSKSNWTPFQNHVGVFPEIVIRRGEIVYKNHEIHRSKGKLI